MGLAQFIQTISSDDKTSSGLLDGTGKQLLNVLELIIGYVCTGQVHVHILGRIGVMPCDCVALHSSDHRLCPCACAKETNSDKRS